MVSSPVGEKTNRENDSCWVLFQERLGAKGGVTERGKLYSQTRSLCDSLIWR